MLQGIGDREGGGLVLKRFEWVEIDDGLDFDLRLLRVIAEDFQLGLVIGQAHRDGEEEAIELWLG